MCRPLANRCCLLARGRHISYEGRNIEDKGGSFLLEGGICQLKGGIYHPRGDTYQLQGALVSWLASYMWYVANTSCVPAGAALCRVGRRGAWSPCPPPLGTPLYPTSHSPAIVGADRRGFHPTKTNKVLFNKSCLQPDLAHLGVTLAGGACHVKDVKIDR